MRRKLPSIQALNCFESAARHQSFTRAAQELSLTQGAVSRQVAALEDFIGLPLFKRTQHGMSLTSAGVDYAHQVTALLNGLERETLELIGKQGPGDSLTIAAVPTFATRWLIPRLPLLKSAHPHLQIHIEARTRPFLFSETQVDAAIYAGTPAQLKAWAGTRAKQLMPEEVVPVCSPALLQGRRHLQPQDLACMPLLHQSTRPEAWRQWFDGMGVDAPAAMTGTRYEQYSMQVAAATCGLGLALIPTLLVESELASGTLVAAWQSPQFSQRSYYLVWPDQDERPALSILSAWLESLLNPGPHGQAN